MYLPPRTTEPATAQLVSGPRSEHMVGSVSSLPVTRFACERNGSLFKKTKSIQTIHLKSNFKEREEHTTCVFVIIYGDINLHFFSYNGRECLLLHSKKVARSRNFQASYQSSSTCSPGLEFLWVTRMGLSDRMDPKGEAALSKEGR